MGDLVALYERVFERPDLMDGRAYNVGGGPANTLSLRELIYYLETRFGYSIKPGQAAVRAGDQPVFVADIRALERDLGWKPRCWPRCRH